MTPWTLIVARAVSSLVSCSPVVSLSLFFFFFFTDTATTEIYTLSLHDALPILYYGTCSALPKLLQGDCGEKAHHDRSEEHTSELQSRQYLVCRLLLEKKNKTVQTVTVSDVGMGAARLLHARTRSRDRMHRAKED